MPATLTVFVYLCVPLALIVLGVIGLLRRPALDPVVSLSSAEIDGKATDLAHTTRGPTKFENFLVQLNKEGNLFYAQYARTSVPSQLACELHWENPAYLGIQFNPEVESLKINPWSRRQSLLEYPDAKGERIELVVPQPLIAYERIPAEGTLDVLVEGTEIENFLLTASDEVQFIAATPRSLVGTKTHLMRMPTVSSQLPSGPPARDRIVEVSASLRHVAVKMASGSITLGQSRLQISPEDKLTIGFKRSARPYTLDDSIRIGRAPNLTVSRQSGKYVLEIRGRAKYAYFNNERLRETGFDKVLYWSLTAVAGGVVSGAIGLYFAWVKKLLTLP